MPEIPGRLIDSSARRSVAAAGAGPYVAHRSGRNVNREASCRGAVTTTSWFVRPRRNRVNHGVRCRQGLVPPPSSMQRGFCSEVSPTSLQALRGAISRDRPTGAGLARHAPLGLPMASPNSRTSRLRR